MQVVHLLELATWHMFDWWHLLTRHTWDETFERVQDVGLLELATWNYWLVTSIDQTHWGWHFWKGSSCLFFGTCHLKWLISDISWLDTLGWHFWKGSSCSFVGTCRLNTMMSEDRTQRGPTKQNSRWLMQPCMNWCCVYDVYAWMYEYVKVLMYECMIVWMYECNLYNCIW